MVQIFLSVQEHHMSLRNFKDCTVFAVTSHNANVERVFSLMQNQWTKERNKLSVATMKGILTLQYNFKDMCCSEFFSFLKSDKAVLKRIRSLEKYAWSEE